VTILIIGVEFGKFHVKENQSLNWDQRPRISLVSFNWYKSSTSLWGHVFPGVESLNNIHTNMSVRRGII
jgi:hypothetical protein